MKDERNDYGITNPDGADKGAYGERKVVYTNDVSHSVREDALRDQEEILRVKEVYDAPDTGARSRLGSSAAPQSDGAPAPDLSALSSASSAAASGSVSAATTSLAVKGGVSALASVVAATVATAVIVVTTFLSILSVNVSLVMADLDRLVFRLETVVEEAEEGEYPTFYALLEGEGYSLQQEVEANAVFSFGGLQPATEYMLTVRDGEGKVWVNESYCTAAKEIPKGHLEAWEQDGTILLFVEEVSLGKGEFYTVTVRDDAGEILFVADDDLPQREFSFLLTAPVRIVATLSVGDRVQSFVTLDLRPDARPPVPQYDYYAATWSWSDGSDAATFLVPETGGGQPLVLEASIDSVILVEPTCISAGSRLFTATVTAEAGTFSEERTQPIAALGHEAGDPISEISATCDGQGTAEHYLCERCGALLDAQGNEITEQQLVLAALGHEYGAPVFTWTPLYGDSSGAEEEPISSDDPAETVSGYTAIATFTCTRDPSHTLVLDAMVTGETTAAGCETDAFTTYVATVSLGGEQYAEQKVETYLGSALGHEYGEPTFTWTLLSSELSGAATDPNLSDEPNYDGVYAVTATFTCTHDPSHVLELDAEVAWDEAFEATCTEAGGVTYYARVTLGDVEYEDERHDVFSATGHSYGEWHEAEEATCDESGRVGYFLCSACGLYFDEHGDEIAEEDLVIPGGHRYGDPIFEWSHENEEYSANAYFLCERDPSHYVVHESEVTMQEGDGYVRYLATVTFDDVEYTSEKRIYEEFSYKEPDVGVDLFVGDMIDCGLLYFSDDAESPLTYLSGLSTLSAVTGEDGTYEVTLVASEFFRMENAQPVETESWVLTSDDPDKVPIGVTIVSGGGENEEDPFILALRYGVRVTYEGGITNALERAYVLDDNGAAIYPPNEDPVREGYLFLGWCTDAEGTERFDFDTPIDEDVTLYAGWIAFTATPSDP